MQYLTLKTLGLAFCLLGFVGAQIADKCPHGWLDRPGSAWCYQMMGTPDTQKTWHGANEACKAQRGFLLSIADWNERIWIAGIVNPTVSSTRHWWLGLQRMNSSNWRWEDGIKGNEQPGNLAGGFLLYWWAGVSDATIGDCMSIFQDFGTKNYVRVWPKDCNQRFNYVCKKPKQVAAACDADHGWGFHDDRCLKVSSDDATADWHQARVACQRDDGDLVTVTTSAIGVAVSDMIVGASTNQIKGATQYWIGLKSSAGNATASEAKGHNWRWVTGRLLQSHDYQPWLGGSEPSLSPELADNTCVRMDGAQGLWLGDSCRGGNSSSFGQVCSSHKRLGCPQYWTEQWDSCYHAFYSSVSWDEADRICSSHGANLIQIKQRPAQQFINRIKSSFTKETSPHIWVGLVRHSGTSRELEWTTGGTASSGFTNWADGQPTQLETAGGDTAGQVIATDPEGRWRVAPAADKESGGFVCEMPLTLQLNEQQTTHAPPPRYSCENGWQLYGSSCYKVEQAHVDWLSARDSCRYQGADLADIRQSHEQRFVESLVTLASQDCWIGLHARTSDAGSFVWSVDGAPAIFFSWAPGQPDIGRGHENCVHFGIDTLGWKIAPCTNPRSYICKAPAMSPDVTQPTIPTTPTEEPESPHCGHSWSADMLTYTCYKFVTEPMAWVDAQHECQHYGGRLLSIATHAEKSYVTGRVQSPVKSKPSMRAGFWIGLNDREVTGQWTWDDGQPVTYLNWAYGRPSHPGLQRACAVVSPDTARWSDEACEKRYASVCKKTVLHTTRAPPTTIQVPDGSARGCVNGYTGYGAMCYKVYGVANSGETWYEAKRRCRMDGGDLASIMNAGEQRFLQELAVDQSEGASYWIGFYDSLGSGSDQMYFQWSDTSVPAYANWGTGMQRFIYHDSCVSSLPIAHGPWSNQHCNEMLPFACKQRQVPVPATTLPPPTTSPPGCGPHFDEVYDGHCLKFAVASAGPLTSAEASQRCASTGGQLAAIASWDVQQHFSLRISQLKEAAAGRNSSLGSFWIGITRHVRVTNWDDGRPVEFTNWGPEGLQFGAAVSSLTVGQWELSVGSNVTHSNYICQRPVLIQTTTLPPTTVSHTAP